MTSFRLAFHRALGTGLANVVVLTMDSDVAVELSGFTVGMFLGAAILGWMEERSVGV